MVLGEQLGEKMNTREIKKFISERWKLILSVVLVFALIVLLLTQCGSGNDDPAKAKEKDLGVVSATSLVADDEESNAESENESKTEEEDGALDELNEAKMFEVNPNLFIIETNKETPVYTYRNLVSENKKLQANSEVAVEKTDSILWLKYAEGDSVNYIYTDDIAGDYEGSTMLEESVQTKLKELQDRYMDGKFWNHMGVEFSGEDTHGIVTDNPCDNFSHGEYYCNKYNGQTKQFFPEYEYLCQCLGFASMLSDMIFGYDEVVRDLGDPQMNGYELRVGDHLRFNEYEFEHSMIITSVHEDYITVAEANRNFQTCEISWGRVLTYDEIYSHYGYTQYFTRYPVTADEHITEEINEGY